MSQGLPAASGVLQRSVTAPGNQPQPQPARVALPRLSEWREEGKFSPMRQALPTSTPLPLPPEWGTRYRTA
ncbi:Basic Leucine Zipper Transcriptional Factor Atf-Like 3 [Manis pentadactyla]|nr:Basic Leucine Zipper Transcriptional Factor Atf-Like 3 [Manis pentadactyla]